MYIEKLRSERKFWTPNTLYRLRIIWEELGLQKTASRNFQFIRLKGQNTPFSLF